MNKAIVPLLILALVAVAGCAGRQSGSPAPSWVHGEAEGYPSSSYLIGRGQAATSADARDRARADLAKVFEVRIEEQTQDRSAHASRGDQAAQSEQEIVRELATRIERVVRGVEIAAQWHDTRTDTHHALAVLPRVRAAHALREEINNLDAATEAYLAQARSEQRLFAQLRVAHHAVSAQRQRAELQRSLRVLDASGQGVPQRWSLGRLEGDYNELLMRVSVRPESSGPYAREIREIVAGALGHAGFTVTAAAEFTVFARLDIEELAPRDGWYWRSGVLEASLRDSHGQSIGARRWLLREAGTDPKLAERRVIERAAAILHEELGDVIMSIAE